MKRWTAIEWCLFVLTLTVPIIIILSILVKVITGEGLSIESATLLSDLLKVITGGVIGIIGTLYQQKK